MITSKTVAQLVLAIVAGIALTIGLNWQAVDPAWGDEGMCGLALVLALLVFILP